MRKNSSISAKELALTSMMTAVVFLATFVPKIPIPLGYAHLGDAVIFLSVFFLPRRAALFAACVGSAFADFLGGFALWILPTLLIKLVMAELALRLSGRSLGRTLAAFLVASLWMAFGYTVFGALLYDGFAAALASTPGLLAEGILNSAVAILLLPILRRRLG